MELLQKEHQRLFKRAQSSKSIHDVQATIDLLKEARDAIERGMLLGDFAYIVYGLLALIFRKERSS